MALKNFAVALHSIKWQALHTLHINWSFYAQINIFACLIQQWKVKMCRWKIKPIPHTAGGPPKCKVLLPCQKHHLKSRHFFCKNGMSHYFDPDTEKNVFVDKSVHPDTFCSVQSVSFYTFTESKLSFLTSISLSWVTIIAPVSPNLLFSFVITTPLVSIWKKHTLI